MKKQTYKKIATDFLESYLAIDKGSWAGRVRRFKEDYRMSSVPGSALLYCESGGLYTTSNKKPSETIRVKTLNGNKTVASFAIEDLQKIIWN